MKLTIIKLTILMLIPFVGKSDNLYFDTIRSPIIWLDNLFEEDFLYKQVYEQDFQWYTLYHYVTIFNSKMGAANVRECQFNYRDRVKLKFNINSKGQLTAIYYLNSSFNSPPFIFIYSGAALTEIQILYPAVYYEFSVSGDTEMNSTLFDTVSIVFIHENNNLVEIDYKYHETQMIINKIEYYDMGFVSRLSSLNHQDTVKCFTMKYVDNTVFVFDRSKLLGQISFDENEEWIHINLLGEFESSRCIFGDNSFICTISYYDGICRRDCWVFCKGVPLYGSTIRMNTRLDGPIDEFISRKMSTKRNHRNLNTKYTGDTGETNITITYKYY